MDIDYEDLYKWIDSHVISRPKRNLNRDFSDAVPLAEILKQHYPKLVDLHNYSPGNAFSNKMINWDTLNRRVLNKLRINLTKKNKEDLVNGKPGAIGQLLAMIKSKVESKEACGDKEADDKVYYIEDTTNFSKEDVVPIKINNGTEMIDRKLVPVETFEKMEKEIAEKQETITLLTNKVDHLEKLLAIKDERIKDLTQQIQSIINTTGESTSNLMSPKSRFFNNIF
ncbi:sperm flagellar protein 1-like [Diorhabda carinulata]|uniref:sperm flagellar protein 1-like n=1 Tax=Diorhabda sublineata TaxID=1163346 RepID=UPI0024E0C2E1|nr:sperm flagellar protein 1-like [Diorhabda sublineata]XP_057660550.1 sperm flagellar protein 1-like [Diorhabda carinulata]